MDGILVVDKPAGPTSHDVVAAVRRALRQKKVGHTGTLDPNATGVLPLVIGQATKIARFFSGGYKGYDARIRLGVTTTTLDAAGEIVEEREVECSEERIREAVAAFNGESEQLPPMYSAKKVDGKRLYQLAREGKEVERSAKLIDIKSIEVTAINLPDVDIHLECSSGTYVRVIAEDLGKALGCGAHLYELRRTAVGPFDLAQSIPLAALEDEPELGRARLVPMRNALAHFPSIAVPKAIEKMIATGHQLTVADLRVLDLPPLNVDDTVILVNDDDALIAIARAEIATDAIGNHRRDERAIKTDKVFLKNH